MKLRWSNGHTAAVEFFPTNREDMANAICNALIEFRRKHGGGRVELHVEATPGRWTDPILKTPTGAHVRSEIAPGQTLCAAGYAHVINCAHRKSPDPEGSPLQVRGTDYVLIVGPGAWHANELYDGCMAAMRYCNEFTGFVADVVDAVKGDTKQ